MPQDLAKYLQSVIVVVGDGYIDEADPTIVHVATAAGPERRPRAAIYVKQDTNASDAIREAIATLAFYDMEDTELVAAFRSEWGDRWYNALMNTYATSLWTLPVDAAVRIINNNRRASKHVEIVDLGDGSFAATAVAQQENTMAVWPIYKSEEQRDRDQVEAVVMEELEEGSWGGYGYWLDEAPDWLESREVPYTPEGDNDVSFDYRTGIVSGGGYLSPPEKEITDEDGIKWHLVKYYNHAGERDCPVCGAGVGDYFKENFEEHYERPPGPEDECGLCEYQYSDMPGFVYIGEGYEALYRSATAHDDETGEWKNVTEEKGEWVFT